MPKPQKTSKLTVNKLHQIRNLVVVLGDQLDFDSPALNGFDPKFDLIWMAEVKYESTHVPSSKHRIVLFLSAMRHFAQEITQKRWPLEYKALEDSDNAGTITGELTKAILTHSPSQVILTQPGDYRVLKDIESTCKELEVNLRILTDTHFFTEIEDFLAHSKSRKQLRMEFWYRELRKKFNILMENGEPSGGQWNFDSENRESFGKKGPPPTPKPYRRSPDRITAEVIELVERIYPTHVGDLSNFAWPVTRAEALQALSEFIDERLQMFGQFEDAMWTNEPWLYHSHVSSSLNLKLLNPREVVKAAENAYLTGKAPISSVEGFIRQILGWREFVRGIYWTKMPGYLELNSLEAKYPLPSYYWTAETQMKCMRECLSQTFKYGYAHHIQRLMVLGLYTLMYGVDPRKVHEWFLSVYVDAVEWVELPNTLGMSQFGDGGIIASKPYIASGKYIQRMSNYCTGCKYDPGISVGENACPMTTLYWDFLIQHKNLLSKNPRMGMQIKNLARLDNKKTIAIQKAAENIRTENQGMLT